MEALYAAISQGYFLFHKATWRQLQIWSISLLTFCKGKTKIARQPSSHSHSTYRMSLQ
jgi:hypothetical protein